MPGRTTAAALMSSLIERARRLQKRIVFPEGGDPRVEAAAERLAREGVARPVLLGQGTTAAGVKLIDPSTSDQTRRYAEWLYEHRRARGMTHMEAQQLARQPLYYASLMVAAGDADGSVGGVAHTTTETVRAALETVGAAHGARLVSSSFLMAFENRDLGHNGVIAFADCAIVVDPSAVDLAEIAVATAETTRRFMDAEPVVALLSFSTKGSARHPEVARIMEALRVVRERAPNLHIDGELQLDAALVPAVARAKAPGSTVAGRANTLIFPNLSAANIGYKLAERVAGATAIGPVLQGLAKPANDVSRGSSAEDIFHAAVLTAIQAESARHAGA